MFDFDCTASRSSSRIEHSSTPMYHPKPVPFSRPSFAMSYSAPPPCDILGSTASSASSAASSPPDSLTSAGSSPSPPSPKVTPSFSSKTRNNKMPKKSSSSNAGKHKSVQVSLEVKVERHRGFHAFFVPLARSMPPAPPSSPVFGQSATLPQDDPWAPQDAKSCDERWVEDVCAGQQQMEIDS